MTCITDIVPSYEQQATRDLSSLANFTATADKTTYAARNEYPIIHYFGIPRHTQSMMASKILTKYFWKFQ